ncbi:MAG: GreA/GreB family elongation factor [Cyclobacteriaceae bacterium]
MKNIIKETDYNTIKGIIHNLTPFEQTREVGQLSHQIESARRIPDATIPNDVIQLNSYFEVELSHPVQCIKMTMTTPKNANLSEQKISVFSPLSIALIGFSQGQVVDWVLPGGPRKIKILKVQNPIYEQVIAG